MNSSKTEKYNRSCLENVRIDECNVLFVTLDSCRYDTVEMADLSVIPSIGSILKARSHATFTLPAHMSFFVGYLPTALESNNLMYYSSEEKQLWRLNTARLRHPDTVGILLKGKTILDGYRNYGYKVIGGGGAGWFNSVIMQSLFDEFYYVGPFNHENIWRSRETSEFISTYVEKIVSRVKNSEKWFLFLNCVETHAPYDYGDSIPKELVDLYNYGCSAWGGKLKRSKELNISKSLLKPIHHQQVRALEVLDNRIGDLIKKLPKNRPVLAVICGDHGEGFGEDFVWGHGIGIDQVLDVPLVIGLLE